MFTQSMDSMTDDIEELLEVPPAERDIAMSMIRRATNFMLRCTPVGDAYIKVTGPQTAFALLCQRIAN